MADESTDSYEYVFRSLKDRGPAHPRLIISDANKGLVAAIKRSFPGASWQRCKVHLIRDILVHIPKKQKKIFATELKAIWLVPNAEIARNEPIR